MSIPSTAQSTARRSQVGLDTYPHQFFSPSNWTMPKTIKEMYRWCRYLFFTNATIGPIIRKKAAYVITDLVYSTTNNNIKNIWKELLEKHLRIKEFEYKMLLDLEVYGVAYMSVVYPFERYLVCPHCKHENLLRDVPRWSYNGSNFVGTCKNCSAQTSMEVKDKPIKNRTRIKLQRWFPQQIKVNKNPITGTVKYTLVIPQWLKKRIKDPKVNKIYVEDTPKEFLEAIKRDMDIELDPDNVYSLKNESISHDDDSFPMPQLLNVMKDAWLHQTYRRSQEAIALDHILPMTMLSPSPTAGGISPHMNTDLRQWQNKIKNYISRWRRDQNSIFTVPFPMQSTQIRGDAQALNVHNDVNQIRQGIAGGLDVPQDFLYGGLTWSGGNVTLRVLENLLIGKLSQINSFLEDWLIPRLSRYCSIRRIDIHHTDFKMADDVQQKQIALGLRQTNTISDQTTIEELGFDYSKEQKRRAEESQKRITEMEVQQIAQAEVQARVAMINARSQIEIQRLQIKFQNEMNPSPEQQAQDAAEQNQQQMDSAQQNQSVYGPELLSAMANHFLKTTPAHEQAHTLNLLKQTDPILARAIEDRTKMIGDQGKDVMKPLPEQKPPTRGPDKAVI